MADIVFDCDQCGLNLLVDEEGAGLEIKCPECAKMLVIPTASALLTQIRKKMQEGTKKHEQLQTEHAKVKEELELARQAASANENARKLSEELSQAREQVKKLTGLNAELEEVLQTVEADLEQETAASAQIASNLNRLTRERDALKERLEQTESQVPLAAGLSELERFRAESAKREAILEGQLSEQAQAIEKERVITKHQAEHMVQELTKAGQQIQALRSANENLQNLLQQAQAEAALNLLSERTPQVATAKPKRSRWPWSRS